MFLHIMIKTQFYALVMGAPSKVRLNFRTSLAILFLCSKRLIKTLFIYSTSLSKFTILSD